MKSFFVTTSTTTFLNFIFLTLSESLSVKLAFTKNEIQFKSSSIHTDSITQKYPETLLNKLFSSVPRREKAIDNISLSFGHMGFVSGIQTSEKICGDGLTLLVGRSASGKSTLLRILGQMEEPFSGKLSINAIRCPLNDQVDGGKSRNNSDDGIKRNEGTSNCYPKPILTDSKPDCFDTKSTIFKRILGSIPDFSIHYQKQAFNAEEIKALKEFVVCEYSQILGFTIEQLHSYTPSNLTPSQQYLFGLTCSCVESSFTGSLFVNENNIIEVPLPVLLLDELLDKETSSVAIKVGNGLLNLTQRGGVVIAATHRPQFLTSVAERIVTLSSGKVLAIEYPNKLKS